MELVTFNPTLAEWYYETFPTVTPPAIFREGWTDGGCTVHLNLGDGASEISVFFNAPPGVRALTVRFRAEYIPEATGNFFPPWNRVSPRVSVGVSRINSWQTFRMFNDDYRFQNDADYAPDPPGARDVQLDIDVSKIVVRINGVATLEIVPDGSTIEVDDYVKAISVTFPAGNHTYKVDPPYGQSATSFGVSNFVISPMGVPAAFWTSFVGTREAT